MDNSEKNENSNISSIFIYSSSDKLIDHEYDKLKKMIEKNQLINNSLQKSMKLIDEIEKDITYNISIKVDELNLLMVNKNEIQKTFDLIISNLQYK